MNLKPIHVLVDYDGGGYNVMLAFADEPNEFDSHYGTRRGAEWHAASLARKHGIDWMTNYPPR
jgi:hypothetical protein